MQTITTIGLDIAKSVFQVHGVDGAGQVVVRRQLKRRSVLAFFQKLPPCLVGIEACASAHHWSRELQALGHTVRLMPPAYVKPYVKRQKPLKNGGSKRTYELTSSIVPQGTSFHRSVELGFSPIGFDPEWFSCGCRHLLPGPPELGAVNPDAVHDHGQPARERHDRLLHPAAPGDLHGPRLEPGPFF
jgi:hypothetical protein